MGRRCVYELLQRGAEALPRRVGIPDPAREALWLLAAAWERSETWVRLHAEAPVADDVAARYEAWLERRAAGVPAHHLTGVCPFWGRPFRVSPAVLVPRPETELIVERALALDLPRKARVLDVGTGSGCLALTLALERTAWRVAATDRAPGALAVARRNAEALGASVILVLADLAEPLAGPLDLVVANLPYVPSAEVGSLPIEVRHDPTLALDGGPDGLVLIRRLLAQLPRILAPGGVALLELGENQAETVVAAARTHGLVAGATIADLGGCERVIELQRPAARTRTACGKKGATQSQRPSGMGRV